MLSEFLCKFIDSIGPVDRFSSLVVIGNEVFEGGLQGIRAGKVMRLQQFALQQTEPNFDLIEPGRVGR